MITMTIRLMIMMIMMMMMMMMLMIMIIMMTMMVMDLRQEQVGVNCTGWVGDMSSGRFLPYHCHCTDLLTHWFIDPLTHWPIIDPLTHWSHDEETGGGSQSIIPAIVGLLLRPSGMLATGMMMILMILYLWLFLKYNLKLNLKCNLEYIL